MSKLKEPQVKQYQYGSAEEMGKVIDFCRQNPAWPRFSEKKVIERMIVAAGIKTRRFVYEKDGDYADPELIYDTFHHIWFPIAEYEGEYLTFGTSAEFQTEAFQQSVFRDEIDQVLYMINNSAELRRRRNGENGGFMLSVREDDGSQDHSGNVRGKRGRGGRGGRGSEKPRGKGAVSYRLDEGVREAESMIYDVEVEEDPYQHPHKPCGCRHCNRGNKIRCHLCGNELTQDDLKDIQAEKDRKERERQIEIEKARKAKEKEEKQRKEAEERERKLSEQRNSLKSSTGNGR